MGRNIAGEVGHKFRIMRKKCKCGKKLYGYGDGIHEVWLCYKCGRFVGRAGGDPIFGTMLKCDPNMVMDLIHEGHLRPIERSGLGQR